MSLTLGRSLVLTNFLEEINPAVLNLIRQSALEVAAVVVGVVGDSEAVGSDVAAREARFEGLLSSGIATEVRNDGAV